MSEKQSNSNEIIVAQATPAGRGGIGILRISGPCENVKRITWEIINKIPVPRQALHCNFLDRNKETIDQGLVLHFPAPNSFTGEDVVEFHGHGGQIVLDKLLRRIIELGARLARPGEFSERAFLNGRMDLAQAEAVADLINASSERAATSALHSLRGDFSKLTNTIIDQVTDLRMHIEAAIDFPDEEIDFIDVKKIAKQIETILKKIELIQAQTKQGVLLQEGIRVAIIGKPNVGKSSLLNYLCGYESAIVTAIPGTTRDLLREFININGLPIHIVDTAGLRHSDDIIEQEGVKRARQEMETVDLLLLVVDEDKIDLQEFAPFLHKLIILHNKIDLTNKPAGIEKYNGDLDKINVSVKTGAGMDQFKKYLADRVGFSNQEEGIFLARRRHLTALETACEYLHAAQSLLTEKPIFELIAEELRLAQVALGEITGQFYTEDLLDKIFSSFCIGK
jgi:tRNA modification GTPase